MIVEIASWSPKWFGLGIDYAEMRKALYAHGALLLSIAIGAAAVSAFAVLAFAVRLSRMGMRDYLGLVLPQWRDAMIGLAGLVLLFIVFLLIKYLVGESPSPKFVVDLYHDAYALGYLPAMVMALVVLAPVTEELLVRGFLLRGWAASRLGPTGAILLTSALDGCHTQYDVLILIDVSASACCSWIANAAAQPRNNRFARHPNTAALIRRDLIPACELNQRRLGARQLQPNTAGSRPKSCFTASPHPTLHQERCPQSNA